MWEALLYRDEVFLIIMKTDDYIFIDWYNLAFGRETEKK